MHHARLHVIHETNGPVLIIPTTQVLKIHIQIASKLQQAQSSLDNNTMIDYYKERYSSIQHSSLQYQRCSGARYDPATRHKLRGVNCTFTMGVRFVGKVVMRSTLMAVQDEKRIQL